MRLIALACLLLAPLATAQDPRIVNDARVRPPAPPSPAPAPGPAGADGEPVHDIPLPRDNVPHATPTPEPGSLPATAAAGQHDVEFLSTTAFPFPTPIPHTPQPAATGLIAHVTRMVRVTLTGKDDGSALADRDALDLADGMMRVRDGEEDVLRGGTGDEVWVILVHTTGGVSAGPDEHYLSAHRDASALSVGDKMRFARIDYAHEWQICTRWLIFRAPYILIATNHTNTLRFLSYAHVFRGGQALHDLLASGKWKDLPVYESKLLPGGDYAWLVEAYIYIGSHFSKATTNIPHVVWLALGAVVSRGLMSWMYPPTPTPAPRPSATRARTSGPGATGSTSTKGQTTSASGAEQDVVAGPKRRTAASEAQGAAE